MAWHEWAYPAAVLLLGYVVLGITGFGSALVVVPLLARQWPLAEVVVLAIVLDVPASILHGGLNLRQVRWSELSRLVPGLAAGSLAGLWLLGRLDKRWLLLALGTYVAAVGLRALLPRPPAPVVAARWSHPVGALVGVIEVMFATAGPVVVAWLQRRLDDVAALRATVPVVMVLAASIAVAVLAASGQVDAATLGPRWAMALPVAGLGVVVGNRVARHIPALLMKRLMAALLVASGLSLMRHFWA